MNMIKLNNKFYILPKDYVKSQKVILVEASLKRRLALGDILTGMGYHVLACKTLDTVTRYPALYNKATFLMSPHSDPVKTIAELAESVGDWSLIPLQVPATR